ncbi:unnamed protein product [Peronospora belbahrii]|uniref:Uncharacterized protein n=1 Tax=Peronospora belbahrii TaxID=622444 RepID=A0AAU9LC91_9STRA|nr:unnamed protein product [Peronospora belbahrii]
MSDLPIKSAEGGMLDHNDFQYLTSFDWKALCFLVDVAGTTTVVAMLKDTPERLQRVAYQDFVNRELADLRRKASVSLVATGSNVVKQSLLCGRAKQRSGLWAGLWPIRDVYGYKGIKDNIRLAFEPPQDEHHHRSAFLVLKLDRLSLLDYIQQARHLASWTSPIRSIW